MSGLLVTVAVVIFFVAQAVIALRTGIVRPYIGWPATVYRRDESPFFFWTGIFAFILIPAALVTVLLLN